MSSVLYDAPGPQGLQRQRRLAVVGGLIVALGAAVVVWRLAGNGIFEARRWDIFAERDVWQFLFTGMWNTLKAAAVAAVLAVALGVLLSTLRRSPRGAVRVPTLAAIELFRGLPVVLLMFFTALVFGVSAFVAVVAGLTIYNGAVIGEILRAGIAALPKGQTEAALAIGLTDRQALRLVLLPQAVRNMLPALIAQLVVLLKDTSLGYIVGYAELLRSIQNLRDFFGNTYLFSVFFVGAGMYIALNVALSMLARRIERRGPRRSAGRVATLENVDAA